MHRATVRRHLDRVVQSVLQYAPVRVAADSYGFRWLNAVAELRPNIGNGVQIVGKQPIPLLKTRSKQDEITKKTPQAESAWSKPDFIEVPLRIRQNHDG